MKSNHSRLGVLSLLILLAIPQAWADEPSAAATPASERVKFSVGAVVDTYYSYNFNNFSHGVQGSGNLGYFNATDDKYTLGLAEISMTAKQGQGRAHVSLMYGEYAPAGYLWEAYAAYSPADWELRFGLMANPMGFEAIESSSNWNYSRSLLFKYTLPLNTLSRNNIGFSAGVSPTNNFSGTAYVYTNSLDPAVPHQGKTWGLKFQYKPQADWSVTLSGITSPLYGVNVDPFAYYLIEGTAQWKATDKVSLGLDAEVAGFNWGGGLSSKAWGIALYARYQIEKDWAVSFRGEELFDELGSLLVYGVGLNNTEAREATLTVEHQFAPHVMGRLEGRFDYGVAGGVPFTVGPFAAGIDPYQVTATAAMVFSL